MASPSMTSFVRDTVADRGPAVGALKPNCMCHLPLERALLIAIVHDAAGGDCRYRSAAGVTAWRVFGHGGAFRADGGRSTAARSRPRPADLVLAQGLHSADAP